jgi:hypothetical protein
VNRGYIRSFSRITINFILKNAFKQKTILKKLQNQRKNSQLTKKQKKRKKKKIKRKLKKNLTLKEWSILWEGMSETTFRE